MLLLSVVHHPLLCFYPKQAAYEAEGEVQLATEPPAPGAPTWGGTPPDVAYTADTMKAKENSRKKDTSWYPTWNYLPSTQWPLSLVQVSVSSWNDYVCGTGGEHKGGRRAPVLRPWSKTSPCGGGDGPMSGSCWASCKQAVGQRTRASGSSSVQRKK